MTVEFDEVRRLTGPNLFWDKPGAVVDIITENEDLDAIAQRWHDWARQCLDSIGWANEQTTHRAHAHGLSLVVSAPLDALYTACDIAEFAWACCAAEIVHQDPPDLQSGLSALVAAWNEERNPALLNLIDEAISLNASWSLDDDMITLGQGVHSQTWPLDQLPAPSRVKWTELTSVPVAYITGTNGKSTSVRLAAEIARCYGLQAGVTSTDFVKIGDEIIEEGDYSGPGGARLVLRDQRTEIAFLEVARGGLLRRGLPVVSVNAALVTNVASDHLGQYGINTVEELAQVKFMVSQALSQDGMLVLNADDENSVRHSASVDVPICWFSPAADNPLIKNNIEAGRPAVFTKDQQFVYHHDQGEEILLAVEQAPMTFAGTAMHNVQNALGVIGLCKSMGIENEAIIEGLQRFGRTISDNPGRGNVYEIDGVTVIVDFAHNEHSVRAVVSMAAQMPAQKRIIMFGHAGDRSDQDIADLTDAVVSLGASHYIISELEKYLRGRSVGEVPALAESVLKKRGIASSQIMHSEAPFDGAKQALSLAEPGDLVLLLTLDQRDKVQRWLAEMSQAQQ